LSSGRVAYILTAFPTVSETFVEGEFRALSQRGLPIDLYATRNFREIIADADEEEDRGLEVRRSPYLFGAKILTAATFFLFRRPRRTLGTLVRILMGNLRSPRYLGHALALLPKSLAFAREMERRGTRHVHGTWAHYPATAAYIVSRLLGITYSFAGHAGLDVVADQTFLAAKLRGARFVLTCHHSTRGCLERLAPECASKIHTIYHGVTISEIPSPGSVPRAAPPEIVSVGRLTPEKGFLDLLGACALLRDRGHSFRARIFGQGPQRPALERKIKRLRLGSFVSLEGIVPHRRILEILASATVVTLPSYLHPNMYRDGIANVLVEAMACGTPVVSTDYDGSRELLKGGSLGILVPEKDVEQLAAAFEAMLRDPEKRAAFSIQGRKRVENEFDRQRNVEVIFTLFRQALMESAENGRPVALSDSLTG